MIFQKIMKLSHTEIYCRNPSICGQKMSAKRKANSNIERPVLPEGVTWSDQISTVKVINNGLLFSKQIVFKGDLVKTNNIYSPLMALMDNNVAICRICNTRRTLSDNKISNMVGHIQDAHPVRIFLL